MASSTTRRRARARRKAKAAQEPPLPQPRESQPAQPPGSPLEKIRCGSGGNASERIGGKRKRNHDGEKTGAHGKEAKRDFDGSNSGILIKNRRVGPLLSIGQSLNLNSRHSLQFASLLSLVSAEKGELKLTNDPNAVIDDESSHSIHMEWSEEKKSNFILMSRASNNIAIKFKLLAVFDAEIMDSKAPKPVLSFSNGFDCDEKWKQTKLLLQEVFGPPDASVKIPNYLYAFSKVNQKFHIRLFKIKNWPYEEREGLNLEKCGPSFVLKPQMFSDSNGSSAFVDQNMFCVDEGMKHFCLTSSAVMLDSSCLSQVPHSFNGLNITLIPAPHDTTEWEEYNITAEEFFDRYHAFKSTEVRGTGPPPRRYKGKLRKFTGPKKVKEYIHLCRPFKLFGRSLLLCCEDIFARSACYQNIELKNIFFRGRKLKILGVKLVGYSDEKAIENLQQVGTVINKLILKLGLIVKDFPADLKGVLKLLEGKEPGKESLTVTELLLLSKNHLCWMEGLDRLLLVEELFTEFQQMELNEQLMVGKGLPDLRQLQNKVMKNWLVEHCYSHRLKSGKQKRKNGRDEKVAALERRSLKLNNSVRDAKVKGEKLYDIRQVMKTPRNAFQHLPQSAAKLIGPMTREESEFIVSSSFTDVYMKAQEGVTRVFANRLKTEQNPTPLDQERATFSRYGRYFQDPDKIEFKDEDVIVTVNT